MCFIFVCRAKLPTLDDLASARSSNPDGVGIAWFEDNSVVYRKGFFSEIQIFEMISERHLPLPIVIHFRLGTSGGRLTSLAHPFEIGAGPALISNKTEKRVLFHNGVISDWKGILISLLPEIVRKYGQLPEGPWSDTRAIALIADLAGESVLELFGDRFLVMDPSDRQIRLYGDWWDRDPGLILSRPISQIQYRGLLGMDDDQIGILLPKASGKRVQEENEEPATAYEILLSETNLDDGEIDDLALECLLNPDSARARLLKLGFDRDDANWIIRELPDELGVGEDKI